MSDIRPYGAGDGTSFYWVRRGAGFSGPLSFTRALVCIDEHGGVTDTGVRADDDPAAPDEASAVLDHLAAGVKQADADLEKRRKGLPDEPSDKPAPMDRATARFYDDGD